MDEKKPLRTPFVILEERESKVPEEQLNIILLKTYCIPNDVILDLPYKIKLGLYMKLLAEQEPKKEELN